MIAATLHGPNVDFAALSPIVALLGGSVVVLLVGLATPSWIREQLVPTLTLAALGTSLGLTVWQWDQRHTTVAGAIRVDALALALTALVVVAGIATTLLSWRDRAPREAAHGEYFALLLGSIAGMAVLVSAQNLVTLFVGIELLSIPLYVLCASERSRASSLESSLKYLIVGSVGSATLLYGLALVYGATGSTDFGPIAASIAAGRASDVLLLSGIALVTTGLCFKASVAPFHQWTPDVYEGAPTPITAFMAVATKAAAFGVLLRLFDVALIGDAVRWAPALAVLAATTIVVGNVGALGQTSLKRMLAYSSVAQAGYILVGVVVSTKLGVRAAVFYLAVYLLMNLAAFAVVIARERETALGDDIDALAGLGTTRPWLAWPMTIAMLSLAGLPATAGFVGKLQLIWAAVDGGYAWLGIVLVIGSKISLGYYLRVVAAIWMRPAAEEFTRIRVRPAMAGGSPEADPAPPVQRHFEVALVAAACGAASLIFGIVPGPLMNALHGAGSALTGLF